MLERHPKLDANGYNYPYEPGRQRKPWRDLLATDLEAVQLSADWLNRWPAQGRIGRYSRTSYALKHAVEDSLAIGDNPRHIPNGSLIVAALIMGLVIRLQHGNPNPFIGVKVPERLRISV